MTTFFGGLMKICDLIPEHQNKTVGYKVDVLLTEELKAKYRNDKSKSRKALIRKAMDDLLAWYNRNLGDIQGKLKINNGSSYKYHYHVGFPTFVDGSNHLYSTSDWFVLYRLEYNNSRGMYTITIYDYDNHNRKKDWNEE